jgi:hypothetical protein
MGLFKIPKEEGKKEVRPAKDPAFSRSHHLSHFTYIYAGILKRVASRFGKRCGEG